MEVHLLVRHRKGDGRTGVLGVNDVGDSTTTGTSGTPPPPPPVGHLRGWRPEPVTQAVSSTAESEARPTRDHRVDAYASVFSCI